MKNLKCKVRYRNLGFMISNSEYLQGVVISEPFIWQSQPHVVVSIDNNCYNVMVVNLILEN